MNQKLAVTLLEREGHTLTVAGNGREALAAPGITTFDLVLMDVQMPEMDGLETTAAIRVRESQRGGHIPIIAMTAHALKGDRERCIEAGMDEYIAKPIHRRQLLETIERAVANFAGPAASAETGSEGPPSGPCADDWSEVYNAAQGDRGLVTTIVRAALEESPRLVAAIGDAIATCDSMALRLAAHTLKGSVRYFGAAQAVDYAAQLERMGQDRDLTAAPPVFANLDVEMARFVKSLANYLETEAATNAPGASNAPTNDYAKHEA